MLQVTLTSFIKSALRFFIARRSEDEWRKVALDRMIKTGKGLHFIPGEDKPFTGSGLRAARVGRSEVFWRGCGDRLGVTGIVRPSPVSRKRSDQLG